MPVISELLAHNAEVIIAADRQPLAFLQKEFPELETIKCPGYDIFYPAAGGNMALTMAMQAPKLLLKIHEENKWLQKIIKEKKIDAVISDQRFGFYSDKVPCAFITHQVTIKSPFGENILYKLNKRFLTKYTQCWIPDVEGIENLSGDLSHKFPLLPNAKFIGPLSRFSGNPRPNVLPPPAAHYQLMAILSGPEPQRTIFENIVLKQVHHLKLKAVVVRGLADREEHRAEGDVEIYSHLETKTMKEKILASEIIFARSGYSTIMDLAVLGKKAILVPTPGQTEQEYLAEYHSRHFYTMKQNAIDLRSALSSESIQRIPLDGKESIKNTVRNFLNEPHNSSVNPS